MKRLFFKTLMLSYTSFENAMWQFDGSCFIDNQSQRRFNKSLIKTMTMKIWSTWCFNLRNLNLISKFSSENWFKKKTTVGMLISLSVISTWKRQQRSSQVNVMSDDSMSIFHMLIGSLTFDLRLLSLIIRTLLSLDDWFKVSFKHLMILKFTNQSRITFKSETSSSKQKSIWTIW